MRQRVYAGDGTGRKGGRRNHRRDRNRHDSRRRSRASDGEVTARTVSPSMRAPQPCDRAVLTAPTPTRYLVMIWMTSWTRDPHFICASDFVRKRISATLLTGWALSISYPPMTSLFTTTLI